MGVKERRLREKIKRSQEIIDAAETVIFSKGIDKATMDDIAKEAELGKATLYTYYKSKDEILLAIRARALDLLEARFKEVAQSDKKGAEKVEGFGKTYFKFAQDYPNYYSFISLFEAIDTKIDVEKSAEHVARVNEVIVKALEEGIADGSIRKNINPFIMAKILWGVSTGVMQMMNIKGEFFKNFHNINFDDLFACFFDMINYGLIKQKKE